MTIQEPLTPEHSMHGSIWKFAVKIKAEVGK